MTNLSHWDFATRLAGLEVVALILGLEPNEYQPTDSCPVFERLREADDDAIATLYDFYSTNPTDEKVPYKKTDLRGSTSSSIEHYWKMKPDKENIVLYIERCYERFVDDSFDRNEISRWLTENGMTSVYRFNLEQTGAAREVHGRWPWGKHHTELLGHLEAAALEFWINYDPQNAKTTAPKNETVIAWLKARKVPGQKRMVSDQMAQAIATMLRLDGLPPGPRT